MSAAKANPIEQEIDEILDRWKSFLDNVGIIEGLEQPQTVVEVRKQMLGVAGNGIEYEMSAITLSGEYALVYMPIATWQALKNARKGNDA